METITPIQLRWPDGSVTPGQLVLSNDTNVHGGTWDARYLQARGELTKEQADEMVNTARQNRRIQRAKARN